VSAGRVLDSLLSWAFVWAFLFCIYVSMDDKSIVTGRFAAALTAELICCSCCAVVLFWSSWSHSPDELRGCAGVLGVAVASAGLLPSRRRSGLVRLLYRLLHSTSFLFICCLQVRWWVSPWMLGVVRLCVLWIYGGRFCGGRAVWSGGGGAVFP
jgi:hypothetical protein